VCRECANCLNGVRARCRDDPGRAVVSPRRPDTAALDGFDDGAVLN
jgi:hypothetical protein